MFSQTFTTMLQQTTNSKASGIFSLIIQFNSTDRVFCISKTDMYPKYKLFEVFNNKHIINS